MIARGYEISERRITRGSRCACGADSEPGEDEARDAEQERGDPVLHVVVARAGLVAREEARQRPRRLDPVDDGDRDQHDADDHGDARRAGGRSASRGA